MSKRDLALRLLLAVAIILNGMTSAAAGAWHDQAPPCHGDHAMADMPQPDLAPAPAPECCEPGQCQCACTQSAQVPVSIRIEPSAAPAAPDLEPLALGHPGPALPHPIRPPIG